jgi:hypothetical protein
MLSGSSCCLQHQSSHIQQQILLGHNPRPVQQRTCTDSASQAMLRALVLLALAAAVPAAVVQLDSCKLHSRISEAPSMTLSVKVSNQYAFHLLF